MLRRTIRLILFFTATIIVTGCDSAEDDVINIAGQYSLSVEYTAIRQGASAHVTGRIGPITITQDGSRILIGEEANGKIDGDSVIFGRSLPLGNTFDEDLTFEGTMNDDGSISGTFSGSYSETVYGIYPTMPSYVVRYSIIQGIFTLYPA